MKLQDLNQIPGGLADNKSLEDVAKHHKIDINKLKAQFENGIKIESEHTSDNKIAVEITLDHLWEDPSYYKKLKKVEENKTVVEAIRIDTSPDSRPETPYDGFPESAEAKLALINNLLLQNGLKVGLVGREGDGWIALVPDNSKYQSLLEPRAENPKPAIEEPRVDPWSKTGIQNPV